MRKRLGPIQKLILERTEGIKTYKALSLYASRTQGRESIRALKERGLIKIDPRTQKIIPQL